MSTPLTATRRQVIQVGVIAVNQAIALNALRRRAIQVGTITLGVPFNNIARLGDYGDGAYGTGPYLGEEV